MTEKLLPCPFCGGEAGYCNTSPGVWRVECIECGATSKERQGYDAMMTTAVCRAIWNRRSPPPAVEGGWRELLREALPHVIESADYDDEGRVGNAVEAARDLVSRIDAALAIEAHTKKMMAG